MPEGTQVCCQVAQSLQTPSARGIPNVVDVLPVQDFGSAYGRGAEAQAEVGHPGRRTFRSTLMLPRNLTTSMPWVAFISADVINDASCISF